MFKALTAFAFVLLAVSSHAIASQSKAELELISLINSKAAGLRARARAGQKGSVCADLFTVKDSDMTLVDKVFAKISPYLPDSVATKSFSGTLTVFIQAEASAKAFIGISAGLGIGVEFSLAKDGANFKGGVNLITCLSGGISIGSTGASASAGGGILVGFGTYANSIDAANVEVGAEVEALGGAGVGVLLQIATDAGIKAFRDKWKKDIAASLNGATDPKSKFVKAKEFCSRFIKSAAVGVLNTVTNSKFLGVHVSGSVGVGAAAGVAVDVDITDLVVKLKDKLVKLYNDNKTTIKTFLGKVADKAKKLFGGF